MGEVPASGKQRGLRDAGNRKKTSGVCFSVVRDFRTLDSDCFLPEGLKKPTPPNCKEWRIFYIALRRWESSITFAVNHGCQISFFLPPWCYFCAGRLWNVCSCSPLYIRFRSSSPAVHLSLFTRSTQRLTEQRGNRRDSRTDTIHFEIKGAVAWFPKWRTASAMRRKRLRYTCLSFKKEWLK